ncbi:hypothetical protein [uncultured Bilophila sp.]|uniref:hypothetical protein n=1 Tax=uncultured Bilophila sp. TaxID=529385 RepID=UPI00280BF2E4|nr:hypothetical protein [uncultured Bilophila sp.]
MSQLSVQQQTSAAFSPLTETPESRPDATRDGIRQIVEQAPVPLTQQLDRVQTHVTDPKQTLSPGTLNERNHETTLTAASRALERTLTEGNGKAIETALENVELARGEAPGDPTPEMAGLIHTVQQRQAPNVHGVPQKDGGPVEEGPGPGTGQPAAANRREIAGAAPVIMEDTGETMEIDGQQVRMEDVPEEAFAALLDYAPDNKNPAPGFRRAGAAPCPGPPLPRHGGLPPRPLFRLQPPCSRSPFPARVAHSKLRPHPGHGQQPVVGFREIRLGA